MKNKYKAVLLLTTLLMFNLVIAFSADAIFADKTAYAIENNASELMVLLGGFILSNILLLFFSEEIFISWLKWIGGWLFLISLIAVFSSQINNPIDQSVLIIFLIVFLPVATLVFALVQRFYFKR